MEKYEKEYYNNTYKYEIIIISIIILFFIILKSKYSNKYIHKLIKTEYNLKDKGIYGIVIFIIIGIILNQFVFLYPIINLSSGFIFGFKKGFIISYILIIISSIVSFYLSKYIFKKIEFDKKYDLNYNFNTIEWIKFNILLRISPTPFNVSNYILSNTNINIITYIIGTMIGVLPWLFLEVFIGSNIKNINNIVKYTN